MTRFVKTLAALTLAATTFAAGPALARIASNGPALNGIEKSNGQTTAVDSQALRVIAIELPR